ncbi:MAG: carbohydrate-binding domain-containing protein [Clostridia bacterium]|nr:carbohydrate-binding domain-containing protein [Clostridia bacterium]
MKRFFIVALSLLLALPMAATATADTEISIVLSDAGITVDGAAVSTDSSSEVYVANDIVYYMENQGSSYGAGSAADGHSAEEANKHTVLHINAGGVYRISGTLSYGQIAVSAADTETVELILDGVNLTCTVAPAIIFYSTYDEEDAETVEAGSAGSIITLADGSENVANGSYVAKIYKTGTTSKLHKYDGAVYSKTSLVIRGESAGSGKLKIVAENEGLCSEMHMCVESGTVEIQSQDDGINVNEDFVSTFIQTGGLIYINAGLGSEGDGVDSNGYMWLKGGTLISFAHNGADGGIDADSPIIIDGGTVIAFGARNDSVDSSSEQPYMELSYSTTKQAGTIVSIFDKATENAILIFSPLRAYQSFTYSSPLLANNSTYYVLSGGTVTEGEAEYGLYDVNNVTYSGGMQQQHGSSMGGGNSGPGGGWGGNPGQGGSNGSNDFTLTASNHSFQNVTNASTVTFSGSVENTKTEVSFTATISNYTTETGATFTYTGASAAVPEQDVQLTVTDVPSEDYYATCLLSDGEEEIAALFPTDVGNYRLTISVTDDNESYYGSSAWYFSVTEGGVATILYGDADCNNEITSADAAEILRHVVKIITLSEQGEINGDADHDGIISSGDAAEILRFIVQLIPSLEPAS